MQKHNPVLNGTTKKAVLTASLFLGVVSLMIVILFFTTIIINSYTPVEAFSWRIESIISAMVSASLGSLAYLIHKFMDTREASQKQADKRAMYQLKTERIAVITQSKIDLMKVKHALKQSGCNSLIDKTN